MPGIPLPAPRRRKPSNTGRKDFSSFKSPQPVRRKKHDQGGAVVNRSAFFARELVVRGSLPGNVLATVFIPCVVILLLAGVACPQAHGDVGVVLNESLDSSLDRITGTGHSAVYFS